MDPVSLGLVLTAGSAAVSAGGAIMGGIAQQDQANYQATVAKYDAQTANANASNDALTQFKQSQMQIGAMRAGYGASGVEQSSGSPLDVLQQSARDAELDRQTIIYKGKLRAWDFNEQAQLDKYQGQLAADSSYFGAASALLKGGASAYQMSQNPSLLAG